MSMTQEPTLAVAGVDGGTETWTAAPNGAFPMCGCEHPQHGLTKHDWMVCRACGLPELRAMLLGPPTA